MRIALEEEDGAEIADFPEAVGELAESLTAAGEMDGGVGQPPAVGSLPRTGARAEPGRGAGSGEEEPLPGRAASREPVRVRVSLIFSRRTFGLAGLLERESGDALFAELDGGFEGEGTGDEDNRDGGEDFAQFVHELLAVHLGEFVVDDDEVEGAFAGGGEGGLGGLVQGDGVAGLTQEEALHLAEYRGVFNDENVGAGRRGGVTHSAAG